VIGDFRTPDILRFGFAPLYIGFVELWDAVMKLKRIMVERQRDQVNFALRRPASPDDVS
jgi:kynureninase